MIRRLRFALVARLNRQYFVTLLQAATLFDREAVQRRVLLVRNSFD